MRLLGQFVLTSLLIAGAMPLLPRVVQSVQSTLRQLRNAPEIEGTTVSQTYVLDPQGWMRFRLDSAAAVARVLTTASLSAPLPEPDSTRVRPGWRYTIAYRIIEAGGRTVDTGTFHFRAQVTFHEDLVDGGIATANQWSQNHLIPADSRQLRIPLTGLAAKPHELHVRVATKEEEIADVTVRVAELEEREDYDDPDLWQRLGAAQIAAICEASVYPPELIAAERRRELLHWRWRPLSPIGVEGRDYVRRVLYTSLARSVPAAKTESNALSIVRPAQNLVFRLPAEQGHVRLHLKRDALDPLAAAIHGTWYPPHSARGQGYRWDFERHELSREVELPIKGGKLELSSGQPVFVQAVWQTREDVEFPLTPHSYLNRTYACDASGLLYRIRHVAGHATPVRVQFRRLLTAASVASLDINWSLLDAELRVLAAGSIPIAEPTSRYDRVDVDSRQMISDPTTKYWQLSSNVRFLRFSADSDEIYVAAANRPPDLPRTVEVRTPSLSSFNERSLHQTWFALRPEQHSELCHTQRTLVVESQVRPPELDADLRANRYRWESFRPTSGWTGRYVMLSAQQQGPARREAAEVTFFETPCNERVTILIPPETVPARDLTLTYMRPAKTNQPLRVVFDDREPIELPAAGIGTAHLGTFPPGQYSLELRAAEPVRAFLNAPQAVPSSAPSVYRKLFAIRANQASFEFEFEKQTWAPERVTLEYFATKPRSQPLEINVRVHGTSTAAHNAVLEGWSGTKHRFLITPAVQPQPVGFVFGSGEPSHQIHDRQRCFIPLGDNLPPGPLRISVTGADSGHDYFLFYRVVPGDYERAEWSAVSLFPLPSPAYELE